MLLGCSVFFPLLLMSPHVYFSLNSVLMATYLRWKNTACKQHVWGAGWFKNPALNRGLEVMMKSGSFSTGLHSTFPPPLCRLNPGSGGGMWVPRGVSGSPRCAEQGSPAVARAEPLLFEIRPTLINQTLSMNENVIKEINCRNTCTNKNPLTYLPGIPVRKH